MKLLLDMNLSADWLPQLAEAHMSAVHWSSVGHATARDAAIMEYAIQNEYVVLTHDLDFGILLAQRRMRKPSVVQIRMRDVYPYIIGTQVVEALQRTASALEADALVTIGPQRTRVRVLPFPSVE